MHEPTPLEPPPPVEAPLELAEELTGKHVACRLNLGGGTTTQVSGVVTGRTVRHGSAVFVEVVSDHTDVRLVRMSLAYDIEVHDG